MYSWEKAMCAYVPDVQFAGTVQGQTRDETKGRSMGFFGGKFATCSSANDLVCWFVWKRLIRPFRGGVDDD